MHKTTATFLVAIALGLTGCATTGTTADNDVCTRYNANNDSPVSEGEFYTLLFDSWDASGDNQLAREEVMDGFENSPFDAWGRNFAAWFDDNESETLNEQEFASAWAELGIFQEWDSNGDASLSATECEQMIAD